MAEPSWWIGTGPAPEQEVVMAEPSVAEPRQHWFNACDICGAIPGVIVRLPDSRLVCFDHPEVRAAYPPPQNPYTQITTDPDAEMDAKIEEARRNRTGIFGDKWPPEPEAAADETPSQKRLADEFWRMTRTPWVW